MPQTYGWDLKNYLNMAYLFTEILFIGWHTELNGVLVSSNCQDLV